MADLSAPARHAAVRCVLDLLAAAAAGFPTPAARAARQAAHALYAPGKSTVWFGGRSLTTPGAVLANSTAASALDLDDGHRGACGHPGAAVIPVALAVAEETNARADDLLAAIAAGYEVAVRIAAARDFSALGAYSSGKWCGYGAVAAAGWLRRTPAVRLANALAISGVSAPNLAAAGSSGYSTQTGNNVKEGIPWATVTGLTALTLADAGFTGPLDILDHPKHFDAARIVEGLGEGFAIEKTYFKPYSGCRWLHAALDAVGALMEEHRLFARDISEIEVHAFSRALLLKNSCDPATLEDAQYSLPYSIALRAISGPGALLPIREEVLRRPDVIDLARRVTLRLDPELDRRFPTETPSRVVLRTGRGQFERLVEKPRGDIGNPMSWETLEAKFRTATRAIMPEEDQEELLAAVGALEAGDFTRLRRALGQPLALAAAIGSSTG